MSRSIGMVDLTQGMNTSDPLTVGALEKWGDGGSLLPRELGALALGTNVTVPIMDAATGRYTGETRIGDLDNAATKPILLPVMEAAIYAETFWRHNTGRSYGHKPEVMAEALEAARSNVGELLGYDPSRHTVVFTSNTSHGMNLLSDIAARDPKHYFVLSLMSHHSAQLPAREKGKYRFFGLHPDGTYDLDSIEQILASLSRQYQVYLVIESESNITGYKPDLKAICAIAGKYGAKVFIDHAQGASNVPIDLGSLEADAFIALSGHKMYALAGSGAVVGPTAFFAGVPMMPAGGTITAVTGDTIFYAEPPLNQEPGTVAYTPQISFGKAAALLKSTGMDKIEEYERRLTQRVLDKLSAVEGVEIIGGVDMLKMRRGPVVSIALKDTLGVWGGMVEYFPPAFIGTALKLFYGIGTRVGFYCSHPYGYFMRGVGAEEANAHALLHMEKRIPGCALLPGDEKIYTTRFSFSMATPPELLDSIPAMLESIRHLSPNNCVIKPDFEGNRWLVDSPERLQIPGELFDLNRNTPCFR